MPDASTSLAAIRSWLPIAGVPAPPRSALGRPFPLGKWCDRGANNQLVRSHVVDHHARAAILAPDIAQQDVDGRVGHIGNGLVDGGQFRPDSGCSGGVV